MKFLKEKKYHENSVHDSKLMVIQQATYTLLPELHVQRNSVFQSFYFPRKRPIVSKQNQTNTKFSHRETEKAFFSFSTSK
jgi:hypothetical protein